MISVSVWVLAGALLAQPVTDMYLPPAQTGGGEYLFNPASASLREALKKPPPRPTDLLDAAALADDLQFLRRGLRKQYIGYAELLQVPDFDVEAQFDQLIARLRAGPARVTFQDSALALFRTLKAHINDRHLELDGAEPDPREQYREYQVLVQEPAPRLEKCTAPEAAISTLRVAPLAGTSGRPARLLTISARPQGDRLGLTCSQSKHLLEVRPPPRGEEGQGGLPAYQWRRAGEAAIIRLRRFKGDPAEQNRLRQFVTDYAQHRRAPMVIFDLRGNEGGDDSHAFGWVEQARRGVWDARTWAVYPAGSYLPWLRWNNHVLDGIRYGRIDDPAAVAARESVKTAWPHRSSDLFVRFVEHRIDTQAKAPYRGRVFVLIDRNCGSAGESAALMFRSALGALLVGERTAGFQEYGNQRVLVLPRTGLRWIFATKRNYFLTPMEAVGMPPDVYLPADLMTAPAERLIPALRSLPRPSDQPVLPAR